MMKRVLLVGALALAAEGQPAGVGELQQKYSWDDLPSLSDVIKKAKEKKDAVMDGITDYKESTKNYLKALKDEAFLTAIKKSGICSYLPKAEKSSAPEIEEGIPGPLSEVKDDPSVNVKECEAVADEVTAESLKDELKGQDFSTVLDKLMKLVTDQSSGYLCEGKNGIHDWLKENADLKDKDPRKYKEELRKQLKGKVGPALSKITSKFCPEEEDGEKGEDGDEDTEKESDDEEADDEEADDDEDGEEEQGDDDKERLFEVGRGQLLVAAGFGSASVVAGALVGALSMALGVVLVRRMTRQPSLPAETEPLAPEEAA